MNIEVLEVSVMRMLVSWFKFGVGACLYSFFCLQTALADDTEIFVSTNTTSINKPNVLFLLDTSSSMNKVDRGQTQTRLEILREVMTDIVTRQKGVNMGIARFTTPGGAIIYPITDPDIVISEPESPTTLVRISSANDDADQTGRAVIFDGRSFIGKDYIGLRFQNVRIPQGVTIKSAVLSLATRVAFADSGYEIFAQQVANAPAFEALDNDLSDRINEDASATGYVAPVTWELPADVTPATGVPDIQQSPDIKTILQPIVDLNGRNLADPAGWCGGNDIVILLKKTTVGTGVPFIANDAEPAFSAALALSYANEASSGTGCFTNTVFNTISNGAHDSEKLINGRISNTSSDLEFWREDSGSRKVEKIALGFENLGIPQGAVISRAVLNLTSDGNSGSVKAKINIHAINSVNPPLDRDALNVRNRDLTSGVTWTITESRDDAWADNVQYSSPNFKSIVQNLVNLNAWDTTGSMTLILKNGSGFRSADSYNGSRSQAPQVEIDFRGRFQPSTTITKRSEMLSIIEALNGAIGTPIADAYAESARYFKGLPVKYGTTRGSNYYGDIANLRISHLGSLSSGKRSQPNGCSDANLNDPDCANEMLYDNPIYQSPIIKDSCQANNIVLLSDGEPTEFEIGAGHTNDLYSRWAIEEGLSGSDASCSRSWSDRGRDCTKKMSKLLWRADRDGLSVEQKIKTHTIGFFTNQSFLEDVATEGGGKYYTAFNKEALSSAFYSITKGILDVNSTFVTSGVSINQFNRASHSNDIYFSLFHPSEEAVWPGNLKKYQLKKGVLVDSSEPQIPAITAGGFVDNAKSYWSSKADGKDVTKGGAAEQLTNARTLYTNISAGGLDIVSDSNVAITAEMVGATGDEDRSKVIGWALGKDVNSATPTAARKTMGDPLHSRPVVVTYSAGDGNTSVYVATNEGFLHSIDAAAGTENWSFIPQELISGLSALQKGGTGSRTYGLDGGISLHIDEVFGVGTPGVIDSGEKAYLYVGMRRGGESYYVFDISSRNNPSLKFFITQTDGGDFDELGQSWSKPIIKKVKTIKRADGTVFSNKTVMIFGGGYSTIQDTAGGGFSDGSSGVGRDIYMVDAYDGTLYWKASVDAVQSAAEGQSAGLLSTMQAIPNTITAFDLDGDAQMDHFYASDVKAQVFRFDIDSEGLITGGRVAHMQDDNAASNNRRFYNSPDIAMIRLKTGSFISISIGSGYRAHPLDTMVNDHFYMIKDEGVLKGIFDMDANLSTLVNITNQAGYDDDGNSIAGKLIYNEDEPKNGWYIDFTNSGEKVLSDSLTFNNSILFTTYAPVGADACRVSKGESRLYVMNIADGNPFIDRNKDHLLDGDDRTISLDTSSIAPEPQVLLNEYGDDIVTILCVGLECMDGLEPPDSVLGIRWIDEKNIDGEDEDE